MFKKAGLSSCVAIVVRSAKGKAQATEIRCVSLEFRYVPRIPSRLGSGDRLLHDLFLDLPPVSGQVLTLILGCLGGHIRLRRR